MYGFHVVHPSFVTRLNHISNFSRVLSGTKPFTRSQCG